MQTIKTAKNKTINSKTLALTAMSAALIAAATAFIRVPTPQGYAHAGDSMVYLTACVLPAPLGFIASAIGGAVADLLAGAAVWAIPSAMIKALNVLPFFFARKLLKRKNKDDKILRPAVLAALPVSSAVTVGGYFVAECLIYDSAAAFAEIPFNLMQALVGAVLFVALGLALDAIKYKQKFNIIK